MGRDEVEPDAVQLGRLPPVQLGDAGEAAAVEPAAESGGHQDRRVAREPAQRGGVEVVVVVVADEDGVDARHLAPGDADGGDPGRGAEDAAGPDGVGEHREAADAHHPAGVSGPGDGDGAGVRTGHRAGGAGQPGDVGEPGGPGSCRALAGEPGERLQTGQRCGQPVVEGPRPHPVLARRPGGGEWRVRGGPVGVLGGGGGGRGSGRGRARGRPVLLLRHRGGSPR